MNEFSQAYMRAMQYAPHIEIMCDCHVELNFLLTYLLTYLITYLDRWKILSDSNPDSVGFRVSDVRIIRYPISKTDIV